LVGLVEGEPMKHFQGSPREQARGRIVAPHLSLASVRARHPLARRGGSGVIEKGLTEKPLAYPVGTAPRRSGTLQAVERICSAPRGSLYSRKLAIVIRLGCGRWRCPPCARGKAAAVRKRFERILWLRQPAMVTLTAARSEDADPTPEAMRKFARRVCSFRRWVARHYGKFQWAWVREVAERKPGCVCLETLACRCGVGGGRLHVHMLWDAPYVPQWVLGAAAVRSGLGSVLDVRRVSGKRAASYVAKYLVKSGQHAAFIRAGCRRFAMRARRAPREESDWRYDSRSPALVAVEELGCYEIDVDAEGWCACEPTKEARAG
jgi:hypothetical protein